MTGERMEFARLRRKLQEKVQDGEFICARCGRYGRGVHLHHMKELCEGGGNETENIIPLCCSCHYEWDFYNEIQPFEEYLIVPPSNLFALSFATRKLERKTSIRELIVALYYERFMAFADKYNKEHAISDGNYYREFEKQNRIFSAIPYSDLPEMLNRYGSFCGIKKVKKFL